LTLPTYHTLLPPPPSSTLFPYTTLFRSRVARRYEEQRLRARGAGRVELLDRHPELGLLGGRHHDRLTAGERDRLRVCRPVRRRQDRKSTRLNSSHVAISYAVFCLKKKK